MTLGNSDSSDMVSAADVVPEGESSQEAATNFRTAKRSERKTAIDDAELLTEEASVREAALTALTVEQERKLVRKVDWRLVPLLCLLYLVKKLDESNVSNAKIMNKGTGRNILTELGISSDEYSLITVVYTVPYIVAEIPSNLLLKKTLPSRWQFRIMATWGITTAATAAVSNLAGLYAVRFFLGLAEAGMFPGIILQLTYWYRPDEIAVRLVWIYALGNLSGILGGLLAYALDHASGAGGLSGWQWLFIIEGAFTVAVAIVIFFILPDFPGNTKWLSPTEKAFLQARLPRNSPRAGEKNFVFREVLSTLRDKRLWLFTLSWAFMTCGKSGVTFFQPTIIENLGFSGVATAQILNIPVFALTMVVICVVGYASSTARVPIPVFPIFCNVVVIASYSVLVAYPNDIGVYIAMTVGNAFGTAWFPVMWPWRSQTINGATGSAFAVAFVNSYGQVGDAVGPQMFLDRYAPRYQLPFALSMGLVALSGVTNLVAWWVTHQTESDTRRHKLARRVARQKNEVVLDDVTDHDAEHTADLRANARRLAHLA
ncbi:major facilitator superfamily domain-containing protein [Xylariaceae sp. FL0804]|nr:major facilitator superfamily domain-containing protein [Xylariaceae sp. FL0804]